MARNYSTTAGRPAWDDLSGHWQGLGQRSDQAVRYKALAEAVAGRAARTVLDVGCGEAVLRSWLPSRVAYSGIEPSGLALPADVQRGWTVYHQPAEDFMAAGRFDAIVMSEMLYYCGDPAGLLVKYGGFLEPGGALIVSILQRPISLARRFTARLKGRMTNRRADRILDRVVKERQWRVVSEQFLRGPRPGALPWRLLVIEPPTFVTVSPKEAPWPS